MTSKTIGILGGLGPQATMLLEMKIHNLSRQFFPFAQNSGYPPMIVHYYRHAPVLLTEKNIPVLPWQADPRMLEVARSLGERSDFIIVPSNGVHLFQKEIEKASGKKMLSMVDLTIEAVKNKGWKRVGALGLMNANIYTGKLKEAGIDVEVIDEDLQAKLNQSIFRVMEGNDDETDKVVAIGAVNLLRKRNTDGIIPGCTEIPILLGKEMCAADIVDPLEILAEKALEYCIS